MSVLARRLSVVSTSIFLLFVLLSNAIAQSPWMWAKRAGMNYPRNSHRALSYNGKIYVYGGNEYKVANQTSPKLEIYDPATDSWASGLDAPTGRWGHAFVEINGKMFAFGGEGPSAGSWNPQVAVYDPNANSWSTKSNWASPRNDCAIGVIGGKAYLAGGRPGYGPTYATANKYDPTTDTWTTIASLQRDRMAAAGAVINGKFYVIGGHFRPAESGPDSITRTVEMYDTSSNTWTYKAPLPIDLAQLRAVVRDSLIYVIGGTQGTSITHILKYSLVSNTWTILSNQEQLNPDGYAVVLGERTFYVGGWVAPSSVTGATKFTVLQPTNPDGFDSFLRIQSGTLNGSAIGASNPTITVQAGSAIAGSVTVSTTNNHSASSVAPLIATPNWGKHSTSYWGINGWISTGANSYTTTINLTAPADTGMHYIFFACSYEIGYPAVASLTNYSGSALWDDGVDVADWNDWQAKMATDSGYVRTLYRAGDGTFGFTRIAGTAIKVNVVKNLQGQPLQISSTNPGRNAMSVAKNATISVSLSSGVNTSTISDSSFVVYGSQTGKIRGTFSFIDSNRTIVFNPSRNFKAGEDICTTLKTLIKSPKGDSLNRPYGWRFKVASTGGNFAFIQDSSLSVPRPTSLACGDFNGDGIIDMAVLSNQASGAFSPGTMTILKGNGDGTFSTAQTIQVGSSPISVVPVDIEGDGNLDLAVVCHHSYVAQIYKNNGQGSFALAQSLSTLVDPNAVVAADFNGDGAVDLAVTTQEVYPGQGHLTIFLNNGMGGFSQKSQVQVGVYPKNPVAADYDGDGDVDIALQNQESNSETVLINDGLGNFSVSQTIPVQVHPFHAVAVDLNNDGNLELVVGHADSNMVSILSNNGTGSFSLSKKISVKYPAYFVDTDLDGDGKVDLAVATGVNNSVELMKNLGSSNFALQSEIKVGSQAQFISAADVNNDGTVDLVVANYISGTISILKNSPFGEATRQLQITDVPNDNGKQVFVKWVVSGPATDIGITKFGVWRLDRGTWTFVDEVPALKDTSYQYVAPTLFDSTKTSGMYWSLFRITVHQPNQYAILGPDSGYSLDNLPPLAPTGGSFRISGNSVVLAWKASINKYGDFRQYVVYRGSDSTFVPGPSNRIAYANDTTFTDVGAVSKGSVYKVAAVDYSGNESPAVSIVVKTSSNEAIGSDIPLSFGLLQNYPNPFNPGTKIDYQLPKESYIELRIYDILGEVTRTLQLGTQAAGYKSIEWDGKNDAGLSVSSGIYFCRLRAGDWTETRRMILIR